jgi:hypothetical protein
MFVRLGIIATVAALTVATFADQLQPWQLKLCTFASALSFGILTAFDIDGKANAVRRAWRELTAAAILFREDPAFQLTDLVTAYRRGEEMIGDVNYIPQRSDVAPRRPPI